MLAEMVNSGIQPLQNLAVMQHVKDVLGQDDKQAWSRARGSRGAWTRWRPEAAGDARGATASGDSVTFADVCLVPQLYAARRFGVDPAQYPTLARVEATCAALPAFQKAHADAQPDAQQPAWSRWWRRGVRRIRVQDAPGESRGVSARSEGARLQAACGAHPVIQHAPAKRFSAEQGGALAEPRA